MEQKDWSLLKIFALSLIISFVLRLIDTYYVNVFMASIIFTIIEETNSTQIIQFYSAIFSLIMFIIGIVLTPLMFYRIGKKFDLKSNLKASIIRILTGAYLGQFFGITTGYIIAIFLNETFNFYWYVYLNSIFSTVFLGMFFTGFSALAIAYLLHND